MNEETLREMRHHFSSFAALLTLEIGRLKAMGTKTGPLERALLNASESFGRVDIILREAMEASAPKSISDESDNFEDDEDDEDDEDEPFFDEMDGGSYDIWEDFESDYSPEVDLWMDVDPSDIWDDIEQDDPNIFADD